MPSAVRSAPKPACIWPLEFVNLPAKMVITGEVPPELQVRVIGPRSIVNKLSQTRLTQTIDLSAIKSGPPYLLPGPQQLFVSPGGGGDPDSAQSHQP